METDPADGATVEAGETVTAVVTWPVEDFAGDAPLYATLACVTVAGSIDEALSTGEQAAANDGEFSRASPCPTGWPRGRRSAPEPPSSATATATGNGTRATTCASRRRRARRPHRWSRRRPPAEVMGATNKQPAPTPVPEVMPLALEQLPRTGPASGLAAIAGMLLILGGAATGCTPRRKPAAR